ncbi:MAG: signal recognition particle-docking protein FtsY [Chlamydiia bacterium]|nr:signal recognition particle-docking protein FtsY [Chlamydiia bacterium]
MFKFLGTKIRALFKGKIDEESIEQLEELFYQADLGPQTSTELSEKVRSLFHKHPKLTSEEVLQVIKEDLTTQLRSLPTPSIPSGTPHVMLIVGVNGNGKTTSIAKLAYHFQNQGKKVLIAAADTFRAAATEQLEKWAAKLGVTLVKGKSGSDPAAVVFDAIEAAKSRGCDLVLIDTAGRLHTKTDLMKELEKIHRVSGKAHPGAPHETLLVLDATVGQNALEQAITFHRFTPLTGLILTKLDGTAKGGTVIALQKRLQLPIKYIGTGESVDALHPFEPLLFVNALFGDKM